MAGNYLQDWFRIWLEAAVAAEPLVPDGSE